MRTKLLLVAILFSLQINAQQCWSKLASGLYHSIAIANDGTLWSWGYNNSGQLGDGTLVDKNVRIGNDVFINGGKHLEDTNTDLYTIKDGIIVVKKGAILPDGFTV